MNKGRLALPPRKAVQHHPLLNYCRCLLERRESDLSTDHIKQHQFSPCRGWVCAFWQHTKINRDGIVLPVLHDTIAGGDDAKHPARVMVGNALWCFSEVNFLRRSKPREQAQTKAVSNLCQGS